MSSQQAQDAGSPPLGAALAATDAAVAILRGDDLYVAYTNPSHQEMFGWPAGDRLRAGRRPPSPDALLAAVDHVLQTETPSRADEVTIPGDRVLSVMCSPVDDGDPPGVLMIAIDTTGQVRAKEHAERRTERLRVLDHATTAVTNEMDPRQELFALAHSVVPDLADACAVYLIDQPAPGDDPDPAGPLRATRLVCVTNPALRVPAPAPEVPLQLAEQRPVARAATSHQTVRHLDADGAHAAATWGEEWLRALAPHSLIAVPLGHPVVAVVSFAACGNRPGYRESDLSLIREITTRADLAIDHARRFQRATEISHALQHGLLPEPVEVDWLDIAVRYRPASPGLEAGGDWYDAMMLPQGGLGLAIGDVVGHDMYAVNTMSQLRSMVRGLAYQPGADPSSVLTALNRLSKHLHIGSLATVVYGQLNRDSRTPGAWLTWANSGHPPPLLLSPDGLATVLDRAGSPMLGLTDRVRGQARVHVPPGGTLLFYTDGLIEDAGRPSSDPISDLTATTTAIGPGRGVHELCDRLTAAAPTRDDLALLAVQVTG